MPDTVTLMGCSGNAIEVDKRVAECSAVIKNLIEDRPSDVEQSAIPLSAVEGEVLKKVVKWCEQHVNDPPEAEDDPDVRKRTDDIGEWDLGFMQVDQDLLFKIILAANYLEIKPLISLGCKTIANMIKGKSPEEIRRIFNIPNLFTPDEEEKIRKENEWTEPSNTT